MGEMSTFLFARPSFLGGVASIMDLGGTLQEYNESLTGEQADKIALASDWTAVGNDVRTAMERVAKDAHLE